MQLMEAFFIFQLLRIGEHILTLALLGLSGWFQVRSASFFTEKKIQASEALHHGPGPEKSWFLVISGQIEKIIIFRKKNILQFSSKFCYFLTMFC